MIRPGKDKSAVDYTLNLLGIRVWKDFCVLLAKSGGEWRPLGPPRPLPVNVPPDYALLAGDELRMTALQYQRAHPDSDLLEVLGQRTRVPRTETQQAFSVI